MKHRKLSHELQRVAGRIRLTRLWTALAINWLIWALLGVVIMALLWPDGSIGVAALTTF